MLLYNLRKGVDEAPAYRNAFGKSPAEVEAQAKQHFAAGNFQTTALSSRPMSGRRFSGARRFRYRRPPGARRPAGGQPVGGRLRAPPARPRKGRRGRGRAGAPGASRGHAQRRGAARILPRPSQAGSGSARSYIEYAKLEPDNEQGRPGPAQSRGHQSEAGRAVRPDGAARHRSAQRLAALEGRHRAQSAQSRLLEGAGGTATWPNTITAEAAKAWRGGEQAATDPAERERMHQARMSIEQQRLDYEAAEKQRQADEEARDIEKLKAEARAEVHALEAEVQPGTAPKADAQGRAVVGWSEAGRQSDRHARARWIVSASRSRLVVQGDNRKTVRLLIADPGKIAISGGGDLALRLRRAKAATRHHRIFPQGQCPAGHRGRGGNHRIPVSDDAGAARYRWLVLAVFVLSSAINYLDRHDARHAGAAGAPRIPSFERRVRLDRVRAFRSPMRRARRLPAC